MAIQTGSVQASRRFPRTITSPHTAPHPADYTRTAVASARRRGDRKSTRLNSSHDQISYAVFCLKKKKTIDNTSISRPAPIYDPAANQSTRQSWRSLGSMDMDADNA